MFSLQGAEISHFLFAMGCLLATAYLLGYLAERFFIPRVIGEVSAGLLLGPTLFNRVTFLKMNLLFRSSNLGYFLFIMFMLAALAGSIGVETIFGALLAGFIVKLAMPKAVSDRINQGLGSCPRP